MQVTSCMLTTRHVHVTILFAVSLLSSTLQSATPSLARNISNRLRQCACVQTQPTADMMYSIAMCDIIFPGIYICTAAVSLALYADMPTHTHCACDTRILLLSHTHTQTSVRHTHFDLQPTWTLTSINLWVLSMAYGTVCVSMYMYEYTKDPVAPHEVEQFIRGTKYIARHIYTCMYIQKPRPLRRFALLAQSML